MAEDPVPRKPPRPHGLDWRPALDEYKQKTYQMGAVDRGEAVGVSADPHQAPDVMGDTMGPTVNLRKLQDQLNRKPLNEIAALVLALTYGEMIEFADAVWKVQPEGSAINQENIPALLHRWAKAQIGTDAENP